MFSSSLKKTVFSRLALQHNTTQVRNKCYKIKPSSLGSFTSTLSASGSSQKTTAAGRSLNSQHLQLLNKNLSMNSMRRSFSVSSTTADVTVNVTFVNYDGIRLTVPGRVGMNVLEVAQLHDIELETGCNGGGSPIHQKQSDEFLEDKYGRGPACHYCHVKIPSPWIDEIENTQPKSGKERDLLEYNWEEEASETNSRLSCQIVLTKALDGLTVFIPDGPPSDMV